MNADNIENTYDNKLLNPNLTIEEILLDSETKYQLRIENPKLLQKFTNYSISRLIKYITEEPQNDNDDKITYYLPFVSSQVFGFQITTICNEFFKSKHENPNGNLASNSNEDIFESQPSITTNIFPYNNEIFKNGSNETHKDDLLSMEIFELPEKNNNQGNLKHEIKEALQPNPHLIKDTHMMPSLWFDLPKLLFKFLDKKNELNPTLAGYFSTAVNSLLMQKRKITIDYIFANHIIDMLIFHSYDLSIFTIIHNILVDESQKLLSDNKNILNSNYTNYVISNLINRIISLGNKSTYLIKFLEELMMNQSLAIYFLSIDNVKLVINFCKSNNYIPAFPILNLMLKLYGNISQLKLKEQLGYIVEESVSCLSVFHNAAMERYAKLNLQSKNISSIKAGVENPLLLDWLKYLISLRIEKIISQLIQFQYPNYFVLLLRTFQFNSIIQLKVSEIYSYCINYCESISLGKLLLESKLIEFIISFFQQCTIPCKCNKGKTYYKPNTIFCIGLALDIDKNISRNQKIKDYLSVNQKWQSVVKDKILSYEKILKIDIGGKIPTNIEEKQAENSINSIFQLYGKDGNEKNLFGQIFELNKVPPNYYNNNKEEAKLDLRIIDEDIFDEPQYVTKKEIPIRNPSPKNQSPPKSEVTLHKLN